MSPKLSIITVCFNEKEGIEETCQSIVAQTYKDFEWIVIDGGSTDGTLDILEKYRDSMKVFISEKDNGVYDAMNKGIKNASGEYLLFLNGGDSFYGVDVVEKAFGGDQKYTGEILYGNCCVVHENGEKTILDFPEKIDRFYLLGTCINHQSAFVQRELFEKFGLYDDSFRILADYEKWMRFMKEGVVFQKLPFVVANFKWFDGWSSSEKTKMLNKQEKEKVLNKYFTAFELRMLFVKQKVKLFWQSVKNRFPS